MNGIRNAMFIIMLMVIIVAFDYTYTISDKIVNATYNNVTAIMPNTITNQSMTMYTSTRSIVYGGGIGILVPFLTFLCFFSSFVNRNQSLTNYLLNAFVIIIATPIFIYLVSEVVSNLLAVTILDTAYMYTIYISNFMYIMVANMLLTLASFVFVRQEGGITL